MYFPFLDNFAGIIKSILIIIITKFIILPRSTST